MFNDSFRNFLENEIAPIAEEIGGFAEAPITTNLGLNNILRSIFSFLFCLDDKKRIFLFY